MRGAGPAIFVICLLALAASALAQSTPQAPAEEGIPVTSKLVIEKCSGCHRQDAKGNLTRISWERTTPEGWELALKRMIRLNGLQLSAQEAREIVQYLAANHGLAPEEAKPALYEAERRIQDEKAPNDGVRDACMACHTLGRVMSWRRSKDEWDLLVKMHIGYFPITEQITFRKLPPAASAPPPPPGTDVRDPVDRAIEYIAKTYPLHSPEWAAWRAEMRAPRLAGKWILMGKQLGSGRIFGEVTIAPGANAYQFTTKARLYYLNSGKTITRSGRSVLYAGYAWRGRSESPDLSDAKEVREVMQVSRDQSQMEGRWFWGAYDEFGIDVTLRRATGGPMALATDQLAIKAGSTSQLTILGDSFPSGLTATDIDLGSGVTVKRLVTQASDRVKVEVEVAKEVVAGKRDVAVRSAVLPAAFAVYDKIDYIKVTPEWAMARLGGAARHPKGNQQFEAIAYNRGADGKPETPDDVNLGPVDVEWSVEEFFSNIGDDDKGYVGSLSVTGLFTPAIEGPNPERKFGRNNHGDVWVVATYKPKDQGDAKPLIARSYLIVTVPLYVRWDQPELSQ